MVSIPLAFILALLVALVLTPVLRAVAPRVGAVDPAGRSFRKAHAGDVPRLGGVAIVAGFYAPLIGLLLVDAGMGTVFRADLAKALGLLAGGLPIVALGIYDDVAGAGAGRKLVVQLAVALALFALGFRIEAISTPFGFAVDLGVFALPVTVLWIVGLINAMNLIDGLDGLAGGIAFFAGLVTLVVAAVNGKAMMMLFMAALTGAVAGFLVFNFNPATIFMGDTGSMFLGYVVAVTSLQTNTKGAATVALLTPVLALGLPIMDTLVAMVRRALRGQAIFQGDREHVHHRLLALGLSQRQAVLVLYGVSFLFGLAALGVTYLRGPETFAVLMAMGLVVAVGIRILWRSERGGASLAELRRRNLHLRARTREALASIETVSSLDRLWEVLQNFAEAAGAHELHLWTHELKPTETPTASRTWLASPLPEEARRALRVNLPGSTGALEIAYRDGGADFSAQEAITLEALAGAVAEALERLQKLAGGEDSQDGEDQKVVRLPRPR